MAYTEGIVLSNLIAIYECSELPVDVIRYIYQIRLQL
jgi:hypothetical protein